MHLTPQRCESYCKRRSFRRYIMRTISPCFYILRLSLAILWSSANADALLGRYPAGTVRPLSRGRRPRRTPASARPQFRIALLQRLMSVDRSSRTHGPARGRSRVCLVEVQTVGWGVRYGVPAHAEQAARDCISGTASARSSGERAGRGACHSPSDTLGALVSRSTVARQSESDSRAGNGGARLCMRDRPCTESPLPPAAR